MLYEVITITLNIDNTFIPEIANIKSVASPSIYNENTFAEPNKISVTESVGSVNGQSISFSLTAYSASVVSIKKKTSLGIDNIASDQLVSSFHNIPNPFSYNFV